MISWRFLACSIVIFCTWSSAVWRKHDRVANKRFTTSSISGNLWRDTCIKIINRNQSFNYVPGSHRTVYPSLAPVTSNAEYISNNKRPSVSLKRNKFSPFSYSLIDSRLKNFTIRTQSSWYYRVQLHKETNSLKVPPR